jgi:hypothetical protein
VTPAVLQQKRRKGEGLAADPEVKQLSRFTGGACGHEGKLIVLIIVILWKEDQPIDL